MKQKLLALTLLTTLLGTSAFAEDIVLNTEKLNEIKKTTRVLAKPSIQVSEGIDKGTYYFLKLNVKQNRGSKTVNAFLEKESGALYIGTRYDKNGQKMTFPLTKKAIETIKKGISFSYGKGTKDLYVVTDPECPYCVNFEKQALGKLDNYRVHVILYPLSFHKKAPAMVEWIMQGQDDAEKKHRMEDVMVNNSQEYMAFMGKKGQKFNYTDTIKVKIDNAIAAAKALRATGTPSVYDDKFSKVNWKSLVTSKVAPKAVVKQEKK
ncbi:MAG: Thiol:disulfide interchange protein, putative [uncultured Sulfurovum sp.]|uniref:Thiol:disulfide interchange protein, putative n=1 Tax=uncultured Sulfurovum sp. TaxID=269237 RepID=A0A6S6SKZ9_9BACT|nr:MAG: Thiol:disulfide interchange protein, putative [uncultured Sulfurovum sp.]